MAAAKSTSRLRDLKKRLTEIRKHFIRSFESKSTTDFNPRQQDLTRAFRIVCHAEIEAYFEDIALLLLQNAKKCWDNDRKANLTITALFANFQMIEKNYPLETKIHKILSDFEKQVIEQNNGIKEHNLLKLFVPLGIDKDDFDVTFLATLDSWGGARGQTAHTSARTQQPIDLVTERETLNLILHGIEDFETKVIPLLRN